MKLFASESGGEEVLGMVGKQKRSCLGVLVRWDFERALASLSEGHAAPWATVGMIPSRHR